MVPDPDPADSGTVTDMNDPRKNPAAYQMCAVNGRELVANNDKADGKENIPALYNLDKCGTISQAEPNNPDSEVKPEGLKQEAGQANDTVSEE